MANKEVQKTIEELEALEKSEKLGMDGIEALEKALAEMEDFDDLSKSEDDDEDDKGGDSDPDEDEGGDDNADDGDDEDDKGGEPVKKSVTEDELADELIKASEAYAELELSVQSMEKSFNEQIGSLTDAVATLTQLMQATGKGVVSLSKSVRDGMEILGGLPAPGKAPVVGERREPTAGRTKSEVVNLIKSAVNEGTVEAHWLSKASIYGEACLSDDVKQKIGL